MNFSKNLCYTHKNDYMFYSTSVEGQSVKVFVTKSYKLVKINFNTEYIFDVEDFITLLASSICKKIFVKNWVLIEILILLLKGQILKYHIKTIRL